VAYNFVYSLGQHSYDADCNLFLRVFTGDVEETVRYEQQALEGEIMRWVQGHNLTAVCWLTIAAAHHAGLSAARNLDNSAVCCEGVEC
jgi:hypothetical protein